MTKLTGIFLLLVISLKSAAQNSLDFGAVWGNGVNIPTSQSLLIEPNESTSLSSAICFHHGLVAQYTIGDKIGLETGFISARNNHHYNYNYSFFYRRLLYSDSGFIPHKSP